MISVKRLRAWREEALQENYPTNLSDATQQKAEADKRLLKVTQELLILMDESKKVIHKERLSKKTSGYHAAEMDFIKNFFKHPNWVYEAVTFKLEKAKYTPDFYDANTNTFIEVISSKQAFFANQQKYEILRKFYPKIKFEIRLSNGELLNAEGVWQRKYWKQKKMHQTNFNLVNFKTNKKH